MEHIHREIELWYKSNAKLAICQGCLYDIGFCCRYTVNIANVTVHNNSDATCSICDGKFTSLYNGVLVLRTLPKPIQQDIIYRQQKDEKLFYDS